MMKKLFFTFFLIFTLFLPLWAQVRLGNFSQKGVATQEMKDDGLVAAHSSLPLNTVIKVKNEANSKEVDVKITNRIGNSPSRIIDLSPAAFKALELKRDGIVTISVNSAASSALAAAAPAAARAAANRGNGQTSGTAAAQPGATQYVPVQTTTTAPGTTVTSGQLPGINVVVTNSSPITTPSAPVYPPAYPPPVYPAYPPPVYPPAYSRSEPNSGDRIIVINTNPNPSYPPPASAPLPAPAAAPASAPAQATSAPQNNSAYLAWMMAMTVEAREMRAAREEREMREAREAREIRELRIAREEREAREIREMREEREAREAREAITAQIAREEREAREARDALDGLIIGELSR